jgi:glutaredoxin-like protein NrdH
MKITVYSNPNCVQCDATKRWLTTNKINFDTKLISDSPEIEPLIQEKGYVAAPVVIAGTQSWSGFRLEKLKSLVALIHGETK